MQIETVCADYSPWAGTDLITGSYTVLPAAQVAEPLPTATRAIRQLAHSGSAPTSSNLVKCLPLIVGGNNSTMTGVRVYGWSYVVPGATDILTGYWEAELLFELAMTAGNLAGPANSRFGTTYFRPDTITLVNPTTAPNWLEVFSPVSVTADLPGWFRFDAQGFRKIEMTCDLGTATAFNCLIRGY